MLEYIKMRPGSVATGDTVLDEVAGELVFDDVSFVYPTRREHPVLENFDFTIPAGKVQALCAVLVLCLCCACAVPVLRHTTHAAIPPTPDQH